MRYLGAKATVFLCILGASWVGGCGGGGSPSVFGASGTGTAGTPTGTGTGAGAGTSSTTGGMIITAPDAATGGGGGLLGDAACVSTAIRGDQRPVTLYFMMDNSQSMSTIDPGQT